MEAFENKSVVESGPVNLSTGSVGKSALDSLIEELEAGTWNCVITSPSQPQNAKSGVMPAPSERPASGSAIAACGSTQCAGCYEVGDGKRIHPPKCGDEYRKWLERWQPRGKPQ